MTSTEQPTRWRPASATPTPADERAQDAAARRVRRSLDAVLNRAATRPTARDRLIELGALSRELDDLRARLEAAKVAAIDERATELPERGQWVTIARELAVTPTRVLQLRSRRP